MISQESDKVSKYFSKPSEYKLQSSPDNYLIGLAMLIVSVPMGIIILISIENIQDIPSSEFKIFMYIISVTFIAFGVFFTFFLYMRLSAYLILSETEIKLSRRFGQIKNQMPWQQINEIQVKFIGKAQAYRSLFRERGTLEILIKEYNNENIITIKFTNMDRIRLERFVKEINRFSGSDGVFSEDKTRSFTKGDRWNWNWDFEI